MKMKDMLLKKNEETILLYNAFAFFMENPDNKRLEELNSLGDFYLDIEEPHIKQEIKCAILYLIKKDYRKAKIHLKRAEKLAPEEPVISFSLAVLKINSGIVYEYVKLISTFKGRFAMISLIASIMIGYEFMGVEKLNKPFGYGVLIMLTFFVVIIYIRKKKFEIRRMEMKKVE